MYSLVKIFLLSLVIFIGNVYSVEAQFNKRKKVEKVSENEKGVGEDELITDDEGGKKKKQIKKAEPIGLPLHDKYSEEVWNYYQEAKALTELFEFIKIELVETRDVESEMTTDLVITNGKGENLTWENALNQLKDIESKLREQEGISLHLEQLSANLTNENVPLKKIGKSLKQSKDNIKIQALATAEIGKTLVELGKNVATILKAQKIKKGK